MLTSAETSRFIALLSMKMITFAVDYRFRSSVGLEQQPSKLWVLGSNPNGITCRKLPIVRCFRYFFFFRFTAVKLFGNKKITYFIQILTAQQVFSIRFNKKADWQQYIA